jgi:hypothetical protein
MGTCEWVGVLGAGQEPLTAGYVIRDGILIGAYPLQTARTTMGIGVGATLSEIQAAYPNSLIQWSYNQGSWWQAMITKPVPAGQIVPAIGFVFDTGTASAPPVATDRTTRITTGIIDFARGWEVCSG